jgi:DNA-binding NarL/FixJ family response regulator
MKPVIGVCKIDDQRLLTGSVTTILNGQQNVTFLGATNPTPALENSKSLMIDVLPIDPNREQAGALQLPAEISPASPGVRIIVFGLNGSDERILEHIAAGATRYVLKDTSFDELLHTIESVYQDRPRCSSGEDSPAIEKVTQVCKGQNRRGAVQEKILTTREQEILELIAAGLSNKEIAHQLNISVSTAKNHVHNLFEKLQVSYRREAVRYAYEHGLLRCPWSYRSAAR